MLIAVHPAVGAPEADVKVKQIAEMQQYEISPHTVGEDRGYCLRPYIEGLHDHGVLPHLAPLKDRGLLGIKMPWNAQQLSQKCRHKIKDILCCAKTTGCFHKSHSHGVQRTHVPAQYVVAAFNLVRMARQLLGTPRSARV